MGKGKDTAVYMYKGKGNVKYVKRKVVLKPQYPFSCEKFNHYNIP